MDSFTRRRMNMTAAEIQRDIDLIRLAYRERGGPSNHKTHWIWIVATYGLSAAIAVCVAVITFNLIK